MVYSRKNGVCTSPVSAENARKSLLRFLNKFTSLVVARLSCLGR
jgi:hypothetical protein